MIPAELVNLAKGIALQAKLDPALVCALCEQESGWNPHAIRYEPAFHQRYIVGLKLPATEDIARAISWGLMQLMGEDARERGFSAPFLSELLDPTTGLTWGCAQFAHFLKLTGHPKPALDLYNGGANKLYASQVLARAPQYRTAAAATSTQEA